MCMVAHKIIANLPLYEMLALIHLVYIYSTSLLPICYNDVNFDPPINFSTGQKFKRAYNIRISLLLHSFVQHLQLYVHVAQDINIIIVDQGSWVVLACINWQLCCSDTDIQVSNN